MFFVPQRVKFRQRSISLLSVLFRHEAAYLSVKSGSGFPHSVQKSDVGFAKKKKEEKETKCVFLEEL